jgi:hypothetical protein
MSTEVFRYAMSRNLGADCRATNGILVIATSMSCDIRKNAIQSGNRTNHYYMEAEQFGRSSRGAKRGREMLGVGAIDQPCNNYWNGSIRSSKREKKHLLTLTEVGIVA